MVITTILTFYKGHLKSPSTFSLPSNTVSYDDLVGISATIHWCVQHPHMMSSSTSSMTKIPLVFLHYVPKGSLTLKRAFEMFFKKLIYLHK